LVERAGFTDVFVIGIQIKWISVKAKPIAIGANPFGALTFVLPRMTNKKKAVNTNSAIKAEVIEYPPGDNKPKPLAANTPGLELSIKKPSFPDAIKYKMPAAAMAPINCATM